MARAAVHLGHCFRQGHGAQQQLLDCKAPIGEEESVAILETFRHDPGVLQNLRAWMSMVQVGAVIVSGIQPEARELAARVETARLK